MVARRPTFRNRCKLIVKNGAAPLAAALCAKATAPGGAGLVGAAAGGCYVAVENLGGWFYDRFP
jgi:hypothetical protein